MNKFKLNFIVLTYNTFSKYFKQLFYKKLNNIEMFLENKIAKKKVCVTKIFFHNFYSLFKLKNVNHQKNW